jgi:hypothetical protein
VSVKEESHRDGLDDVHTQELRSARLLLESPSIAARVSSYLATPIDRGMKLLPAGARETILAVTKTSLDAALRLALSSLGDGRPQVSSLGHKAGAAAAGALGGAFGLSALAIELPLSTTIMLRSIADIARSEGEDLNDRRAQLACLEVFALGGPAAEDDAAESGYFAGRAALAAAVSEAARYAASHGSVRQGAPALVRLISQIAARFSIPVTEKAAAQAVPVVGAAGGALINTLFIDHFQAVARGHFVIRRLERVYGDAAVRAAYEALPPGRDDAD